MDQAYSSSIIESWSDLSALKTEWMALCERNPHLSLFHTWEWQEAWHKAQISKPEYWVIAVRHQGQLVGIAPLYRSKFAVLGLATIKALRFIGDRASGAEYSNFLIDSRHTNPSIKALLGALANKKSEWDVLWMPNIARWENASAELIGCFKSHPHFKMFERSREFSSFDLPNRIENYTASLSKSRRYDIRRTRKIFDTKADVNIRTTTTEEDLKQDLADLFALHQQRWQHVNQDGSFVRKPELRAFYEHFVPMAFKNGWLHMMSLEDGGATKAIQIGYCYKAKGYALQEGFDPTYQEGAGNYLRYHYIKSCIDKQLQEYDFLGEQTLHKARWGAKIRQGSDCLIVAKKPSTFPFLLRAIWPTGKFLKEVI